MTASTGNHAMAVLHAYRQASRLFPSRPAAARPIVFVPTTVAPHKAERLARGGAEVRKVGEQCVETEAAARALATELGVPFVSPYNDPFIAGGQGSLAVEAMACLPRGPLKVFVPVGGGGLIAGVAAMLKTAGGGDVEVHGCEPAASDAMQRGVRAGRVLEPGEWPEVSGPGVCGARSWKRIGAE